MKYLFHKCFNSNKPFDLALSLQRIEDKEIRQIQKVERLIEQPCRYMESDKKKENKGQMLIKMEVIYNQMEFQSP